MEPDRPFKLIVYGPNAAQILTNIVEVELSKSELQAVMIVLGTAPTMMLDTGKGTEVREALAQLAVATK